MVNLLLPTERSCPRWVVIGYNCSFLNYSAMIGGQEEVTAAAVSP